MNRSGRTMPGSLSVVIAAGGTGGHIYPGLALAEAIRAAVPDARLGFVGTRRGWRERSFQRPVSH
jgi:UDP-N-acetylglucosamine--N-acetylmuramyl-(pentapeptide) pyrophosphoryl-undecaprenol N-acetylglucosamine transferase